MPTLNSKATIIGMAVIASATATLLHEGLGHGVTAWLRGDIPTELTSTHLSAMRADRLVDAGGTIVNLIVGTLALFASRNSGDRANIRYFFWILAALNLLPGAGYFLFSGIFGFGDWNEVIHGLPHQFLIRLVMTLLGAVLYFFVVKQLAIAVRPFVSPEQSYNVVGRLPYLAACIFSCVAGVLDPLGIKLLLVSTIPAAFGGSSGLMWADNLMPSSVPPQPLVVHRAPAWWFAAAIIGLPYIYILGRGFQFAH
jgi:hypothetical protein